MMNPSEILTKIGRRPVVFIESQDESGKWSGFIDIGGYFLPLTADKCRELAGILTKLGDSLDMKNKEGEYGKRT